MDIIEIHPFDMYLYRQNREIPPTPEAVKAVEQ